MARSSGPRCGSDIRRRRGVSKNRVSNGRTSSRVRSRRKAMNRTTLAAPALLCVASTDASSGVSGRKRSLRKSSPAARSNGAPSRPSIWGMPAVNYELMLQEMRSRSAARQPGRLLGPSPRLAQPDAHAKSGRHLPHDVLQYQGVGPIVHRRAAGGRRRIVQRQHRHTSGRCRSRTWGCWGSTRARAANTCSCRPAMTRPLPEGYIPLQSDTYAATRCCARTSRATATPTSPGRWPTASR